MTGPRGASRHSLRALVVLLTVLASACGGTAATQTPGVPTASKPAGTVEFWQNWATRTPQLRVIHGLLEHAQCLVVDLEGHRERMAILAAMRE